LVYSSPGFRFAEEKIVLPKKPEDWLEIASPPQKARGIFQTLLGYAPGVGKTFSM